MTDDPRGRQDPSISAGFQHDDLDVSLSLDPAGGGVPSGSFSVPMLEPDGSDDFSPAAQPPPPAAQPPAPAPAANYDDGFVPQVPGAPVDRAPQASAPPAPPAAPTPEPAAPPAAPPRQSAFQRVAVPEAPQEQYVPPVAPPAHPQAPPAQDAVPTPAPFPGDPGPTAHDMSIPSLDDLIGPAAEGRRKSGDAAGRPFPVVPPNFGAANAAPPAPGGQISFADDQMPTVPPQPDTPADGQFAAPAPESFPTDPAAPATTGGIFVPDVTAGTAPSYEGDLSQAPALDDLAPPTGEIPIPGYAPPLGSAPLAGPASVEVPSLEEPPAPAVQPPVEQPPAPADAAAFDMPAPGGPPAYGVDQPTGAPTGFAMPSSDEGLAPAPGVDAFGSPGGDFTPQPGAGFMPQPGGGLAPQPGSFAPEPGAAPTAGPGTFQPGAAPTMGVGGTFSPDDLARPMGWEAAGMSAVSAEDEAEYIGYRPEAFAEPEPMPELDPVDDVGADADVASEVFSELSSLASLRPKVEKTRAGLVKREKQQAPPAPAPVAEPQQAAGAAQPDYERDPEAVRTRVSSFYSGKFRAQADAAEFERTMQGASANEVTP